MTPSATKAPPQAEPVSRVCRARPVHCRLRNGNKSFLATAAAESSPPNCWRHFLAGIRQSSSRQAGRSGGAASKRRPIRIHHRFFCGYARFSSRVEILVNLP